jgi:hypothetical protein
MKHTPFERHPYTTQTRDDLARGIKWGIRLTLVAAIIACAAGITLIIRSAQ